MNKIIKEIKWAFIVALISYVASMIIIAINYRIVMRTEVIDDIVFFLPIVMLPLLSVLIWFGNKFSFIYFFLASVFEFIMLFLLDSLAQDITIVWDNTIYVFSVIGIIFVCILEGGISLFYFLLKNIITYSKKVVHNLKSKEENNDIIGKTIVQEEKVTLFEKLKNLKNLNSPYRMLILSFIVALSSFLIYYAFFFFSTGSGMIITWEILFPIVMFLSPISSIYIHAKWKYPKEFICFVGLFEMVIITLTSYYLVVWQGEYDQGVGWFALPKCAIAWLMFIIFGFNAKNKILKYICRGILGLFLASYIIMLFISITAGLIL